MKDYTIFYTKIFSEFHPGYARKISVILEGPMVISQYGIWGEMVD